MAINIREIFKSVARCPNVKICFEPGSEGHPCSQIVNYQKATSGVTRYDEFQLPEPWTGEIDVAPILFIGSNPSVGEDTHSLGSSSDEEVWDSHHHVFGNGSKVYTFEGKYTTLPSGERNPRHVATWAGVKKRAEELMPGRSVVPGVDYALTEVVHCKSRNEVGVVSALDTCVGLHFNNVMSASAATVVVALGKARQKIRALYNIPLSETLAEREMGGRTRLIAFLGHPTGPEVRTFQAIYPNELERLRNTVAAGLRRT